MHCCGNPLHDIAANFPVLASAVVAGLAPILGWVRVATRSKRCKHKHGGC